MSRKVDMTKLLAKIAAVTNKEVEELEQVRERYSYEEAVLEMQSVINFYHARIRPVQGPKETPVEFQARQNAWHIKKCKGCNLDFAYSYTYDGVAFCSLDCLDGELRSIGLKLTYGRDLKKRWGTYHPAIVPSSALEILRSLGESESESADDPSLTDLPTLHPSDSA